MSEDYLKDNPPLAGGPLTSKPAWSNASGRSATPAFSLSAARDALARQGGHGGQGQFDRGGAGKRRRQSLSSGGGRATRPESVTVALSEGTQAVTLRGALSPAEKTLAGSPAGAAQVQGLRHRSLSPVEDES
jgi:Na+-translocating membrane potential-generating system (MpsC)